MPQGPYNSTLIGSAPVRTPPQPATLCLGHPRFPGGALAATAARDGDAAAWSQAFAEYGPRAPSLVSGDFALALGLPGGGTFLAVDRFAIRTLCYRQVGEALSFGERADALATLPPELDQQAIFDYFFFHSILAPETIFSNVYRVPAGHYVMFESGTLTVAPYWTPSFEERRSEPFDQLRAEFRKILFESIRDHLDGSSVGCFLSGGTDSSTVAGIWGKVSGRPASTYSIGFDAQGYDEMEYARIAARHFGMDHHEYYLTPTDLVGSIPEVAAYYDQPFGNSSCLPAYYCARIARADGVTKMLAGDGGDELFGGNSRYAKQRVFGWYGSVPSALRTLLEPILGLPSIQRLRLLRKAQSYVEQARVPMPDRLQMYNLVLRLGLDNMFEPAFLQQVDVRQGTRQQRDVWNRTQAESLINRMLAFDWRYTLAENDLPKVCNTAKMAGLEVGFPLLDDRLLEFSLRLPPQFKLKGLKLRWFFKEALRGFLPDEIISKKKHGFGLPFGIWAMEHAKLKRLAEESLRSFALRRMMRSEFIDDLLFKHLPAHPGYYGEMVWLIMMMEQWLRHHAPSYRIDH